MTNKTVKKSITEDYGQAVERMHGIQGTFTPQLMALVRISCACTLDMPLSEALDREDRQALALLLEHLRSLMIIYDRHYPHRELTADQLNQVRDILSD